MSNVTTALIWILQFGVLISFMMGCSYEEASNIPELENLILVSERDNSLLPIYLEKETVFASSEDNLIGRLGQFDIDDDGRVYIADAMQHRVHVFDPAGLYLTHFGREGAGPGEFRAMGALIYSQGDLYIYDPLMMRLSTFSTESYEESNTIYTQAINKREVEELSGLNQSGFIFIKPNRFLVNFTSRLVPNPDHAGYNLNDNDRTYHLMGGDRRIDLEHLFKKPGYKALSASVNGQYRFTQFEFLGSTLITTTENTIYMARSEDFLIKVYDSDGSYLRAYYYPFQKKVFTREQAIQQQEHKYEEGVVEWRVSVIEQAPEEQSPDFWPALNDLVVDNENRIWVSTIVEDFDIYEWWVLENTGEVITKFDWPRDEPIEVIKNGYVYTRQIEEETGLQQVVKYRIAFEEG